MKHLPVRWRLVLHFAKIQKRTIRKGRNIKFMNNDFREKHLVKKRMKLERKRKQSMVSGETQEEFLTPLKSASTSESSRLSSCGTLRFFSRCSSLLFFRRERYNAGEVWDTYNAAQLCALLNGHLFTESRGQSNLDSIKVTKSMQPMTMNRTSDKGFLN